MIFTKFQSRLGFSLVLAILCLALLLIGSAALAQAGPTLPPRDPLATPQPHGDSDKSHKKKPIGAYIALQASTAPAGSWTVVQWQDSAGGWHDVEGWQGPLEGNSKYWWVAAGDFGKGPFQWVVASGPGSPPLATSAPFHLPSGANETVQVQIGTSGN